MSEYVKFWGFGGFTLCQYILTSLTHLLNYLAPIKEFIALYLDWKSHLLSSTCSTPVLGEYYYISWKDLGNTTPHSPKWPPKITTKNDPKKDPKNNPTKWPLKKTPPDSCTQSLRLWWNQLPQNNEASKTEFFSLKSVWFSIQISY